MTLDQFFTQLKLSLSDSFFTPVYEDARIRVKSDIGETYCPVAFVCKEVIDKRFSDDNWEEAATCLGLNLDDAAELVYAADHADAELRDRLHRTCFLGPIHKEQKKC